MEINAHYHFDTQIAIGMAWDRVPGGVWLSLYVPFITFCLNIVKVFPVGDSNDR